MPQKRNAGLCYCMMFQGVTVATMDCSVHGRVERGVREVAVTPLTVPVSVHQDGNRQRVTQVCLNLISHKGVVVAWSHPVYAVVQTICIPKSERIGCDRFFFKLLHDCYPPPHSHTHTHCHYDNSWHGLWVCREFRMDICHKNAMPVCVIAWRFRVWQWLLWTAVYTDVWRGVWGR